VLWFGGRSVIDGGLTVGSFVAFNAYVVMLVWPLRVLGQRVTTVQKALAASTRIIEVLEAEPQLREPRHPADLEARGDVRLERVRFGHEGDRFVLDGLDLHVAPGESLALVGATGSGKSTVAGLLARLYDPLQGEVLLDGRDIRSFSPEERTQKIGFILQEPILFSGTVKENILLGNTEYAGYSNDQLEHVIRNSGLQKLLNGFDKGLDTPVGIAAEGISLGQKQLIAFIRAVLRHPDLLILDEATANIDTITEQILQEILDKLPAHTTRVIIAHRLNTIQNADEIFFVNAGEIIRAGSFDHAVDMLMEGHRAS